MVVQLADKPLGKYTHMHTGEDQTGRKDETDSPQPAAPKWIFHFDLIWVCTMGLTVPLDWI